MLPSRRTKPPPLDGLGDLDERIRQAEQRLVAREQALGRRVGALGQRLRRALQPQRLAMPLLGGAAALLAVGWWAGRRTGGGARGGPAPPGAQQPAADPWWTHLISLGWPMLPRAWREQAGPAVALVLGLGLAGRHRRPPSVPAGGDPAGTCLAAPAVSSTP